MPFLDAKALDNDPEGMAFLRAVLRPSRSGTDAGPRPDEPAAPRSPFAPLEPQDDVPLGSIPCDATAPRPAPAQLL